MSSSFDEAVSRLASQADAMGRLAQDSGGFAAVIAAFESKDADAFRWVLERLEMLPYCELICEWVRIKLCVLRCSELCIPIDREPEVPSLEQFAQAVVRLAENDQALRRVVDAVNCGNAQEYASALQELKLQEYCSLICHWVCGVGYRRVCEVVCRQEPIAIADAVSEIRSTGNVIARLMEKRGSMASIAKVALQPCEIVRDTIGAVGFAGNCEIICRLICAWRCYRVCRILCEIREPVLTGEYGIEEARSFALAFRKLAGQPRALADLVTAVQNGNADAYSAVINKFGLRPYCLQICRWVCSVSCHEFCFCVCPPPQLQPWFTKVGNFGIYADIDGSTGLTNKALPAIWPQEFGGGPNFAFFETLQLSGFCPATSPTSPGTPMMYRFLYSANKTSLAAAINDSQTTITVAGGASAPATPFTVSVCNAGESGETMTVTAVAATTWTVTRGADGTTPLAAGSGATLWINPQPITGSLIFPTPVGSRTIAWPKESGGLATAGTQVISQPLFVYAAPFVPPPEPAPPGVGNPWFAPSAHYIAADPVTGWIDVDQNAVGGGFQVLLDFDTQQTTEAAGGDPIPGAFGNPGGAPAGSAVSAAGQKVGVDMTIIFQATRTTVSTVDYSNSLCRIHVNNWNAVNNLWFQEFTSGGGCCQPIDDTLTVEFTVDHELLSSGAWALGISSCALPTSLNLTPPDPTPGVTFTPGGRGANGTIVEDTTTWTNCSYTAALTTRPGRTTGLADDQGETNLLTFCICGH
jgi:hypothetical protein